MTHFMALDTTNVVDGAFTYNIAYNNDAVTTVLKKFKMKLQMKLLSICEMYFYSQQRIPTSPLKGEYMSKKIWIVTIAIQRYKERLVMFGIIYTRTHNRHTPHTQSIIIH